MAAFLSEVNSTVFFFSSHQKKLKPEKKKKDTLKGEKGPLDIYSY